MTVIREKKVYKYPTPNSASASDTESLNLGSTSVSDTESVNDEAINPTARLRVYTSTHLHRNLIEDRIHIKKSLGRKKLRRYQDRCMLQTLNEEDDENEYIVIMESYKTPFSRLLEDKTAMDCWQNFIAQSEKKQKEIIDNLSKSIQGKKNYQMGRENSDEKPGRISSRIKRTLKIRKHLSIEIVKVCEEDLIEFFRCTPKDIYIKCPSTSFDRLLLHGIAQYHRLNSISALTDNGTTKSVKVFNTIDSWEPANCFLSDFIKQLRKME